MIDLHTHSTCSDGTYDPRDLVALAWKEGISALSLTDHDCIDGIPEAREEARGRGMRFLCGLEISAEYSPGTMHILGYGFDTEDAALNERLHFVKQAREDRNPRIIRKLNDLGMDITEEEVRKESGGGLVGRPHMATLLRKKGYVNSNQEAFDRYLAKGQPAYVNRTRLSPEESIAAIRSARGVAVLAHPNQLEARDDAHLLDIIGRLLDAGLDGIECYYRDHSPEDTNRFLRLAEAHGLLATGGSDFHGDNRPDIRLGRGLGDLEVPPSCWRRLEETLEERRV